jgi:hypothetical protein
MVYDYNPIHAVWYILCEMLGLSTDWLHTGDFSDVADDLFYDGLGISILFGQQQDALSYLESINTHVDMLLRYDSDGKFHPKLIRNDYTPAMLPLVDEYMLQEEPEFTRGSWIETINEVKVQYSEIVGRVAAWMPRGCIGWYKVDEGSGLILHNSAPAGVNKLPDLDVVTPGSNFWGQYLGFGYWDGAATVVNKDLSMAPFPDKSGTFIIFGREKLGVPDATYRYLYHFYPGIAWHIHDYYNYIILQLLVMAKIMTPTNQLNLVPLSSYYDKPFVNVFTHDTEQAQVLKVKYHGDESWGIDVQSVATTGFNHVGITKIGLGYDPNTPAPDETWKGTLGDFMICNVLLTDAEIDEVVTELGARWGI